jgi:hypothetical protein
MLYAWDWKTVAFMRHTVFDVMRDAIQFMYYQLAWNAAYPKKKLRGMIVCIIPKTQKPDIQHVFVLPPGRMEQQIVQNTSARALEEIAKGEPYYCNTKCCYDWNDTCEYLAADICRRC